MNNNEFIPKALEYLYKNIEKNCDLITMLEVFPQSIQFFYCNDDGVCFKHVDSICISTDSQSVAEKVSQIIPKTKSAICKNEHDYVVLNAINKFEHTDKVIQYIYTKTENFDDENIKILSPDYIDFIVEHYSHKTSAEEIASAMKHFNFFGYFLDGQLVGFIGRHFDGEIGYLEILPEFRRNGYGTKLIQKIVNEKIPTIAFSQVLTDNYKSIKLQDKLGAKKYEKLVYWCY